MAPKIIGDARKLPLAKNINPSPTCRKPREIERLLENLKNMHSEKEILERRIGETHFAEKRLCKLRLIALKFRMEHTVRKIYSLQNWEVRAARARGESDF